jgi:hypothetical protein
MVASDISIIVEKLAHLARSCEDEFSPLASIAASSANASASRAELQRSHLGAAARHTVAASASSLLGGYLKSRRLDDVAMREALAAAFRLGAGREPRHVAIPQALSPAGWEAHEDGSLSRRSHLGRSYRITYDPAKPGGDWTLSVDGLPVAAGEGGHELCGIAAGIETFIRGPQPFRRKIPAMTIAD